MAGQKLWWHAGGALEKAYGEPEPFDVWWYPELKEGGIPNDDLEMQLIWLKALEEIGPQLRAADLAQYWLDHIGYNWDEYGLNKTNLRLGLLPPVSGYYNNWFKDCMGSPIRSEIWACIAPGMPKIAAKYAYEDSIVDHAGGESVFGELFNAAIESAAFVVSNPIQLLDIGASYVPPWSQTAKAITAARQAYTDDVDWKSARRRVLEATPHYNAQYSPINIGFQVIGWLYGTDFGDAICKAVNCGYDTDCTGATLGSYLGIVAGGAALPQKWTEPLGENISTNESWGGLNYTLVGRNPIPANLAELTERVCIQAKRVLTAHGVLNGDSILNVEIEDLYADESIHALWNASATHIEYPNSALGVIVDYINTPAVIPGENKELLVQLTNPHPKEQVVRYELYGHHGWETATQSGDVAIPASSKADVKLTIPVPTTAAVENTNPLFLVIIPQERPIQPAIPVVLLGSYRYLHSELYPANGLSDRELFDQVLEPEKISNTDLILTREGRPGQWRDLYARDNELPLQDIFSNAGVLYTRTYIWNPGNTIEAWIGAATNCPSKLWVNSQWALESFRYPLVRPNYGGNNETYAKMPLRSGWNEIVLKSVRGENTPTFVGYLMLSDANNLHAGLSSIGRTHTPWDK
ncbi:ADP-ribosylglycohydrolase family protein [Dictyobacter kobayashii]|uniref:ADP-ribosylglycohydrolase family protein n=1 Tax=Dictyobacter kobayashii TaxID=2014872 RepID=UPI001387196F|nr:ADP-ribosylglycohydrolase family protein [Dictyobacter kobayashii]